MVQSIVDQSITIYDNESLIALYKVASTHVIKYATDIRNLKAAPANTQLRTELRETINLALDNLDQGVEMDSKQTYAVSELFMYMLMATTRLLLLRDLCVNGTAWDVPAATITSSYMPELRNCIASYTKWCVDTYKVGYNKLKADNADDVNLFNKLQQYRNYMITQVFDVVSLWPFLNPNQFPKGAVQMQRARVLLSDTVGCPVGTTIGPNYYTAKSSDLEKLVTSNKYYVWRGDHEKLYLGKDEMLTRFITISNGFHNRNSATVRRDTTVPGSEIVVPEESVGSSESANEKVTITYDIIPRAFALSVAGSIKCTEDSSTYTAAQA
ncbi:hypothetical protein SAMD00019534_070620 [Acytostelium subglobosum LB1]|uniref:hypothetical protein n=1 Tax=Acytostelium subglobosum LB1 TaxID=1410327 RepID=UPI000644A6F3|nr:hypothetical protein SAMD00019534_070620 [Acytostelium subglobosum LB1]GAM23887.1 hypothetical protein SAMD00019534_070620 [Acytostelium subglobosum LB1]|eukprot:XP_012752923.1 hypothetical protein SAMD00019534_070620 [Acytostelium subglobosum LB1]